MVKAEIRTLDFLDVYIAAFLALRGIRPALETRNGRVVFCFPQTENLYKAIADYNSNVSVPVADFVVAVKTLRGQMLSLRGEGRR